MLIRDTSPTTTIAPTTTPIVIPAVVPALEGCTFGTHWYPFQRHRRSGEIAGLHSVPVQNQAPSGENRAGGGCGGVVPISCTIIAER